MSPSWSSKVDARHVLAAESPHAIEPLDPPACYVLHVAAGQRVGGRLFAVVTTVYGFALVEPPGVFHGAGFVYGAWWSRLGHDVGPESRRACRRIPLVEFRRAAEAGWPQIDPSSPPGWVA